MRLAPRFPLCDRVFLAAGCARDVEAVKGRAGTGRQGEFYLEFRRQRERLLTSTMSPKAGDVTQVVQDFHFSAGPTVTAGFIGFAFDIR